MAIKIAGNPTTTTLNISFTTDNIVTKFNADSTPTAKIFKNGSLDSTLTGSSITNAVTGVYSITWTPADAGSYKVVWEFIVAGVEYTQDEDIEVLANESTSVTESDVPDVGLSKVCKVTATFIDSGGNYKEGIYVRFSPLYDAHNNMPLGFINGDVTATSNNVGQLTIYLHRGVEGLLTITGVGLSRRVKIPDQASIDLFELTSLGLDSFEVQTPVYYEAPRRS